MRRSRAANGVVLFAFVLAIGLAGCASNPRPTEMLVTASRSVVAIGDERMVIASGFVVEGSAILTNHHVTRASALYLVQADGRRIELTVLATDEAQDLALLQLKVQTEKFPPLRINNNGVRVGEPVWALGNPFGLSMTATQGIVSALPTAIGKQHLLQTDAAINPGNSGGPLVNANGEAVGIVSARGAVGSGIGFAVPASRLRQFLGR